MDYTLLTKHIKYIRKLCDKCAEGATQKQYEFYNSRMNLYETMLRSAIELEEELKKAKRLAPLEKKRLHKLLHRKYATMAGICDMFENLASERSAENV